VFDVDGVTVIVDYAHNCAAYAALAETARAMTPGRLVGVVAAPGDRRDADLVDIGAPARPASTNWSCTRPRTAAARPAKSPRCWCRVRAWGKYEADSLQVELNVHRRSARVSPAASRATLLVFGCGPDRR
jgi:cyanophycin synthetase